MGDYNDIFKYYVKELEALKTEGERFSNFFPNVAESLKSDFLQYKEEYGDEDLGKYVTKIIESFAFLVARLKLQSDSLFPEVSKNLLHILYPDLADVMPAVGLVQFSFDESKKNLSSSILERGCELSAENLDGITCRYSLVEDFHFAPIKIEKISVEHGEIIGKIGKFLRIDLRIFGEISQDFPVKFYFTNDYKYKIYDAIYASDKKIYAFSDNLEEKLFEAEVESDSFDSTVVNKKYTYKSYGILKDYVTFPDKFLNFGLKISNVREKIVLFISLNEELINFDCSDKLIRENVTPIINLYKKHTEPIIFDRKTVEYMMIPDARNYDHEEIFDINHIYKIVDDGGKFEEIPHYFYASKFDNISWSMRRSLNVKNAGFDVFISFIESKIDNFIYDVAAFYADITCMNRNVGDKIGISNNFFIEKSIQVKKIELVNQMRKAFHFTNQEQYFLKLVKFLNINYISFTEKSDKIKKKIDDFIATFYEHFVDKKYISIIDSIAISDIIKRNNVEKWKYCALGKKIDISFYEYSVGSVILFAKIIFELLNSNISINNFLEVGVFKKWHQMTILSGKTGIQSLI